MKIYRNGKYLCIRFGNAHDYIEYTYTLDIPFWLRRAGDICVALTLVLALYFIWPRIPANSSPSQILWNVQLPIFVWIMLYGLLASGILLRWWIAPSLATRYQKEKMKRLQKEIAEATAIQSDKGEVG